MSKQSRILVDADACPVKEQVYKVAFRHKVKVTLVANSYLRIPQHPDIQLMVVSDGFDAADDWIADQAGGKDIIITADILLADRCLKAGATVIAPTGKPFTPDTIGGAIATRAIMADLRGSGDQVGGGHKPFSKKDRSAFLQALDAAAVKIAK